MYRVTLRDMGELKTAYHRLMSQAPKEAHRALRISAHGARTAVISQIMRTVPRPIASRAYVDGWHVMDTRLGAIMGNSQIHAIFVEEGRLPGKMPPVDAILRWMGHIRFKSKTASKRMSSEKYKRRVAFAIAQNIGRKGVPGRYPMKKTMPKVQKIVNAEMKSALKRLHR